MLEGKKVVVRKIAANYIYLPGYCLIKNGYAVMENKKVKTVVETGGVIKEIQGLEFYGGLLVPGYMSGKESLFKEKEPFLEMLLQIYKENGDNYEGIAILEGADLLHLKWRNSARFRKL